MGPNLEGGRLPFWWTDRTPKSEDGSQEMGMPEDWGFSWLSPAFVSERIETNAKFSNSYCSHCDSTTATPTASGENHRNVFFTTYPFLHCSDIGNDECGSDTVTLAMLAMSAHRHGTEPQPHPPPPMKNRGGDLCDVSCAHHAGVLKLSSGAGATAIMM